jgi:hypothetical protein
VRPNAPLNWKRVLGLGFGLGLIVIVALIGCSESAPLAPDLSGSVSTSASPNLAVHLDGGGAGGGGSASDTDPGSDLEGSSLLNGGLLPELVDVVEAPITGQVVENRKRISALLGGTITAGRHTLVFPPGALRSDTIITLRDLTGVKGRVECEALPEGLSFRLPVLLTSRFSDLVLVRAHTMYWIVGEDTPDEEWVPVGGVVSIGNLGLSVNLRHFSKYAPGKAGW